MKRRQESEANSGVTKRAKKLVDIMRAQKAAEQASQTGSVATRLTPDSSDDPDAADIALPTTVSAMAAQPGRTDFAVDSSMMTVLEKAIKTLINDQQNLFITGPAGCGKTWIVRNLAGRLREQRKRVAVIAPTGTTAIAVDGTTCDAYFGLSPTTRKAPLSKLIETARGELIQPKLQKLDILIIDEISMVSHEFLQQMDALMKEARMKNLPFGGVRVVLVGDFAQLPPVRPQSFCMDCGSERRVRQKQHTMYCKKCDEAVELSQKWAFTAPVWAQLRLAKILLEKVLRQTCPIYKEIIWDMWLGNNLNEAQLQLLRSHTKVIGTTTSLFCRRDLTQEHNKVHYRDVSGAEQRFTAIDDCIAHQSHRFSQEHKIDTYDPGTSFLTYYKDHRYPEVLRLKLDMPVVLLANIDADHGLVNGIRGVVVAWDYSGPEDVPRISDTIANSGFDWDTKLGRRSRDFVPSLNEMHWSRRQNRIRNFIADERNNGQAWPVVRFSNGKERTIFADCVSEEYGFDGEISILMRTQIPLLPAWGMTVHRAQGMTLDHYIADLSDAWCPGLEYVALSRATSLEAIEIYGLGHQLKYRTPEEVRRFHKSCFPELGSRMHD